MNRFKKKLRKFDHVLLLVSLILLVSSPIIEKMFRVGWLVTDVLIMVIIVSGLSVTYSHRASKLNLKNYFGFLTIVLSVIDFIFEPTETFSSVTQFFQVAYFLVLTVVLFNLIIKSQSVDYEVVMNSLSGYFLLGISWAIVLSIWVNNYPESFSFAKDHGNNLFNSIYFAFVTMSTLGYGDLLPVSAPAKAISILIAITGAFYTTIVLGMIVGKFISYESYKQLKKD